VWPGWGHASENPDLPKQLKALGVTFIGPPSPVMSVLGDKIAANILAQTAGVPSIPWSGDGLTAELTEEGTIPDETFRKGLVSTAAEAVACAERIGYPVMVKASEGGGGKGIRMCGSKEEIEANFPQVQNEAPPGSPIFVMQLCQGARHIEVQIIGDQHGNAVALNGRDCSTQRRFQKIFEEGPPTIVPKETFLEMERAAQRLTQNIGYVGAGTVEYLFNAQSKEFYFLELNPRLQVEHPVTEELTRVNLPATQLQVCMGIPLERIPQIRRFYGKALDDNTSSIDFLKDNYVYPDRHVIAARITAENPDDGFKPTSGRIDRIKFQSSVACWGYFSVGANGSIHEYADSQFGHIFAHGGNREEARKALMLSLRNMDVVGDIRNPVEYLVELLATTSFIDNTIDTSWLDGLIKAKSVELKYDDADVVFYAAVFRAMRMLKGRQEELVTALGKGQLGPLDQLATMNSFPVEIAFKGTKYNFQVERGAADLLVFSIGGRSIRAKVREQPDGSIFVSVGKSVMTVFGTEEALGLRLRLEGVATILLPTLYDPSELRSEFNGKVVRYLQDDGAVVKEGEPYVELEAMKMIMPVKATAAGKITHTRGAGSIVSAGELLGSMELSDPSKVKKIVPFTGDFKMSTGSEDEESEDMMAQVQLALDGYVPRQEPAGLVQKLFVNAPPYLYTELATAVLERYLAVEEKYAEEVRKNISPDQTYLALIEQNKESLEKVASIALARSQLAARNEIVLSTLRGVRATSNGTDLVDLVKRISALPSEHGYGEVALIARQYSERINAKPFEERSSSLRARLDTPSPDFQELCSLKATEGGAEVLAEQLKDESEVVRKNAVEALVRRIYRQFPGLELQVSDEGPSKLTCKYSFQYPDVPVEGEQITRNGLACVLPNFGDLKDVLSGSLPMEDSTGKAANTMTALISPNAFKCEKMSFYSTDLEFTEMIQEAEALLQQSASALKAAGVRKFILMLPQAPHTPRIATFLVEQDWKEQPSCRDMRSTFRHVLEIDRLDELYDLERIVPAVGRSSQVLVGTKKGEAKSKLGKSKTVFAQTISHTFDQSLEGDAWMEWPESLVLSAVDELERARLKPEVGSKPNSHIFVHFNTLLDMDAEPVVSNLERFMNGFVAKHGNRLQKSKVDEIALKIGIGNESTGRKQTIRLTATSMGGEYLKTSAVFEKVDPLTGTPVSWTDVRSGEESSLDNPMAGRMELKRRIARAAGSTYAPEFLGMIKLELIKKWGEYRKAGGQRPVPTDLFSSVELVPGPDGDLVESTRSPGENSVGVIAWRCTLATPEYPQGRDIVIIANDVTFQAGSFGVAEDDVFQKASEYARERGLPRIHIACNSGARVGLAEELKPYVKAKWTDASDPSKGFDFLYLDEEDYNRFDAGTVVAREETVDGKKVFAIDAIIGEGLKSTAGGIGVENLKGSGLIAGETSRAYNEIFTLSYVTGRSVGIGAYLNRLGQRVIQMVNGPMILTGFGALNKLLGKKVYTSQDQLGGPQVMVPNGVTHKLVQSDQDGVSAILDWLAFTPKTASDSPPLLDPTDPPERDVTFVPTKTPYDPRHMLAGTTTPEGEKLSGFFDEGSFQECLEGWGRSVVAGRAKLGGVPMGVIAVETRNMDRRVPADPANPASQEVVEPQAGQVWFPDSAHKTAAAIRDFNRGENLPLMIFANWRGFSGGTRDMYNEVLKFGAQIVDALVEYKHPVFVYIPPGGELRGGSWVVIDPAINPAQMEMYADVESRGGILEPAGIVEVKFRAPQQNELMHRLDPDLQKLDALLENSTSSEVAAGDSTKDIEAQIRAREEKLAPLYTQIACEFADLHDRSGRMEAKGVIRKGLEWRRAREFFFFRVRRRLLEQDAVNRLQAVDASLSAEAAKEMVASWIPEEDDKAAVDAYDASAVDAKIEAARVESLKRSLKELYEQLPEGERADALS
jgi:acetyl-CoA carboxylase/biotin carboxylase 1